MFCCCCLSLCELCCCVCMRCMRLQQAYNHHSSFDYLPYGSDHHYAHLNEQKLSLSNIQSHTEPTTAQSAHLIHLRLLHFNLSSFEVVGFSGVCEKAKDITDRCFIKPKWANVLTFSLHQKQGNRNSSLNNENLLIIYSPTCPPRSLRLPFFRKRWKPTFNNSSTPVKSHWFWPFWWQLVTRHARSNDLRCY